MNSFWRLFPAVRRLEKENAKLRAAAADGAQERARLDQLLREQAGAFPPGHFYSPLPSRGGIAGAWARGGFGPPFPAVDLNEAGQFARLERFATFYPQQPFPEKAGPTRRF